MTAPKIRHSLADPHTHRPAGHAWRAIDDWHSHAACRAMGTGLFFGPDSEAPAARRQRERLAKKVCRACPVRRNCLDHSLTHERYGVWGGLDERERARLGATPKPSRPRYSFGRSNGDTRT